MKPSRFIELTFELKNVIKELNIANKRIIDLETENKILKDTLKAVEENLEQSFAENISISKET